MKVAVLGIDLAKNIFQLHGEDTDGRVVLQRGVRRDRQMVEVEALPPCTAAIEACRALFTGSGASRPQGIAFGSSRRST